jgi:hypothetical protein
MNSESLQWEGTPEAGTKPQKEDQILVVRDASGRYMKLQRTPRRNFEYDGTEVVQMEIEGIYMNMEHLMDCIEGNSIPEPNY